MSVNEGHAGSGAVTTTDNTATQIWSYNLDDNTVYHFRLIVVGRQTDAANRARYCRDVTVFREAGGNATLIGSAISLIGDAISNILWGGVTVQVSGTQLQLLVTGPLLAANISWYASGQIIASIS